MSSSSLSCAGRKDESFALSSRGDMWNHLSVFFLENALKSRKCSYIGIRFQNQTLFIPSSSRSHRPRRARISGSSASLKDGISKSERERWSATCPEIVPCLAKCELYPRVAYLNLVSGSYRLRDSEHVLSRLDRQDRHIVSGYRKPKHDPVSSVIRNNNLSKSFLICAYAHVVTKQLLRVNCFLVSYRGNIDACPACP